MKVDKKDGSHRITLLNEIVSNPNREFALIFPVDHLTLIVSIRWYFKALRRIDAEKQLMSDVNDHGSFLVRKQID